MGIDVENGFNDLLEHEGHVIQIVHYSKDGVIWNVSLECVTCGMVLLDYDNPEMNKDED